MVGAAAQACWSGASSAETSLDSSSELRVHLGRDQLEVVEVGEVEDLQVGPLRPGVAPRGRAGRAPRRACRPDRSCRARPGRGRSRRADGRPRPRPRRRRSRARWSRSATPGRGRASRRPRARARNCSRPSSSAWNGRLNSVAYAPRARRPARPVPADDDGDAVLHGLGQCGRVLERRSASPEKEKRSPTGVAQSPVTISSCSSSRSKRLHVGERDAVGAVLAVEPARAQAELDPAAAHLVDLRDRDRERAGEPEGRRGHQRAEPDRVGVAGQAGQRHPGVGRSGQAVGRPSRGSGRSGRTRRSRAARSPGRRRGGRRTTRPAGAR